MSKPFKPYNKSGTVPAFALCIDWETSGSNFGGNSAEEYQGIAFGAAVFKTDTFEIVAEIKCYVKFDETRYKWTAEAEKIHGITREFLEENGVTQEEAALQLANFCLEYFGANPKILVLGHNVEFDIAFTKQLLEQFEVMFQVHHVLLDTSGAGLIAFNKYKSDQLFELIGLPPRGDHDPLEDVRYTIELAKSIRMLVNAALNGG